MAFEIYNGTGTGFNALAKLNEMWDFDTYDDSGSTHIATCGNVKLEATSTYMYLKTLSGTTLFENRLSGLAFKIVKATNAIVLFWTYNNEPQVIVLGTMTDLSGNVGIGGVSRNGSTGNVVYITSEQQRAITSQQVGNLMSDTITQIIPITSNKTGSFTFDNIYFLFVTTITDPYPGSIAGMYKIGDDSYYLANCILIKEE